jgi:hypothetical protein
LLIVVIKAHFLAQFYDAIKGIFPDIIMLLTDSNAYVQLAGISVIQGLIEHGM